MLSLCTKIARHDPLLRQVFHDRSLVGTCDSVLSLQYITHPKGHAFMPRFYIQFALRDPSIMIGFHASALYSVCKT